MSSDKRYRYAVFSDQLKLIENLYEAIDKAVEDGATAFSVHSFSERLNPEGGNSQIWGDLHLRCRKKSLLSSVEVLLKVYKVPLSSMDIYEDGNWYELVIQENSFRGELGSKGRFRFEIEVVKSLRNAFSQRLHLRVPVTDAGVLQKRKLSQHRVLKEVVEAIAGSEVYPEKSKVSLLAEKYFKYLYIDAEKSSYRRKIGHMMACPLFEAMYSAGERSPAEVVLTAHLFGYAPRSFMKYIERVGGETFPIDTLSNLDDSDFSFGNLWCDHVSDLLKEIGSKIHCKRNCGVTSPLGLQYLGYHPEFKKGYENSSGDCVVRRDGTFLRVEDVEKKIMEPIGIKDRYLGVDREIGACEVICVDADGFRRNLLIDESDFDSPRLFAILRSHNVYVPPGKLEKGAVRKFLASQFPQKLRSSRQVKVTSYAGWQSDRQYIFHEFTHANDSSSIKLKCRAEPPRHEIEECWDIYSPSQVSSPIVLFANLAALASPLMSRLPVEGGICLHFYGKDLRHRTSFVRAVSKILGQAYADGFYPFTEAQKHIRSLKAIHKDSTLIISDFENRRVLDLVPFVNRYFKGRKNAEPPSSGVIISSGRDSLTPEMAASASVFMKNKNALALSLCVDEVEAYSIARQDLMREKVVRWFQSDQRFELGKVYDDFIRDSKANRRVAGFRKVASVFGVCAAIGDHFYEYERGMMDWWTGEKPSSVLLNFIEIFDQRDVEYFDVLKCSGSYLI